MEVDLRRRVLEAAVEVMRESGASSLSMREVARRAGVSHQAPYHHFKDREGILAALVEQGYAELSDRLQAASLLGTTAHDRLTASGCAYVEFALERPEHFRLMFRGDVVDLVDHAEAKQQAERAFTVLEKTVDGLLKADLPGTRAQWVQVTWSVVHGLATLMLEGRPGASLREPAARKRHVRGVIAAWASTVT